MNQNLVAVILASAIGVPLALLAWNARRAIEQNDTSAKAIQDAAVKMAEFKGEVAGSIRRLEAILTGSDGQNGIRSEVTLIRKRLHEMSDDQHARLGEWTVWRTKTDGRIDLLEQSAEATTPTPPFRRVRRKADKVL